GSALAGAVPALAGPVRLKAGLCTDGTKRNAVVWSTPDSEWRHHTRFKSHSPRVGIQACSGPSDTIQWVCHALSNSSLCVTAWDFSDTNDRRRSVESG